MVNYSLLFDEIVKILKVLDNRWEDIVNRKDNGIFCGNYRVYAKKDNYDDAEEYWGVRIDFIGFGSSKTVLSFFSKGMNHKNLNSLLENDYSLLITSLSDSITYRDPKTMLFEKDFSLPFDSTSSPEERLFAIDLTYDDEKLREGLRRIIQLQTLNMKHIDIYAYSFHFTEELLDGDIYNELIKRPFFKIGVQK